MNAVFVAKFTPRTQGQGISEYGESYRHIHEKIKKFRNILVKRMFPEIIILESCLPSEII